jgi:stress response protein YsnF
LWLRRGRTPRPVSRPSKNYAQTRKIYKRKYLRTEEEVVEKRPVAKEEVRIRKDVVEDTETVEEDVRREGVDVDEGATGRTS